MSKNFLIIVVSAIVLRLLISAITYHSDIQTSDLASLVLSKGYVLSFYDYFPKLQPGDIALTTFSNFNFNYPPAVYFVLGIFSLIFSIFVSHAFFLNFLFKTQLALPSFEIYTHLLTLKIPFLIFDLLTAYFLAKLFTNPKQKMGALILWLFNPISIYASFMMGQFDVIPVFFTVLSIYFALKSNSKRNLYLAALSLGIGAAFKIYPLFLLVPLMSLTEKWNERVRMILIGVVPYILSILPFLPSHGFRSSALVAGQTLKSLYAQIPVSGGESILLFVTVLLFVYLLMLNTKSIIELLWQKYLVVLLIFFIFTHFHPQWLLWLTPFLIMELIHNNFKNWLAVKIIFLSWFGMIWFFDPGLNIGLFSPINPNLYNSPGIWQMLNINIDYNFSRSILQSIFAAAGFYYIYLYFPRKKDS